MTMPTRGINSGAPDFQAATAWRQSQVEEYGAWVAAGDIYVGNALAYTEGDPVPATNVAAYGYDVAGLVRRPDGWTDPVPGDGIEDAPVRPSGVEGEPAALSEPLADDDPDAPVVEQPAKNAPLPDWQEYAMSVDRNLTPDNLKGVTKKELQDKYGRWDDDGDTGA